MGGTYDEVDGRWAMRLDGDVVTLLDDPFDSAYRLGDNAIAEVHRTIGDDRFVIVIGDREQTFDQRWLPSRFSVFHWSVAGHRLVRADHYRDAPVTVGGVCLPAGREVVSATDEGLLTRRLDLTDHVVIPHG